MAEARALTNIGSGYTSLGVSLIELDEARAQGTFREALKHFTMVQAIAERITDLDLLSRTTGHLGNTHDLLGEYTPATACHTRRVQLERDRGDIAAEGRAWCNLGNSFRLQGLVDNSIDCYLKDLKICIEAGDVGGEAITCCNLAHAFQAKGDFRSTKSYFERYIALSTRLGDTVGLLVGYGRLARVYQAVGRYDDALACLHSQMELAQSLDDSAEQERVQASIDSVHRQAQQGRLVSHEEAMDALISALEEEESKAPPSQKRFVMLVFDYLLSDHDPSCVWYFEENMV